MSEESKKAKFYGRQRVRKQPRNLTLRQVLDDDGDETMRPCVRMVGRERIKLEAIIDEAAVAAAILQDPEDAKRLFWAQLKNYFACL